MNNLTISPYKNFTFGKNLSKTVSSALKFKRDDFFVNITGYGKNTNWADEVILTADNATENIKKMQAFIDVVQNIADGAKKANLIPLDLTKRLHTGILRAFYEGWQRDYKDWKGISLTPYSSKKGKYKLYAEKFEETKKKPLINPYPDINLTIPTVIRHESCLLHPNGKSVVSGFKLIEKIYNELQKKFCATEITPKDIEEINEQIAEMRWIMAHIMPFERGSDLISNIFMRAMYKSYGIKTYPTVKNLSLDLEAYCTPIEQYIKKFPSYFEKSPEIAK